MSDGVEVSDSGFFAVADAMEMVSPNVCERLSAALVDGSCSVQAGSELHLLRRTVGSLESNSYQQHEKLIEELFESDRLRGIDPPSYGNTDEAGSESAEGLEPISSEVFIQKVNAVLQSLIQRYPDAAIYFPMTKIEYMTNFPSWDRVSFTVSTILFRRELLNIRGIPC